MRQQVTPRQIWNKNRLLIISTITILVLFFPIGLIHELGHVLVCVNNGYDYTLTLGDLALITHCSDTPQPIKLYFALGGIFGLAASAILFMVPIIRKNNGIFIGVCVTAFDHFLKIIFETFKHNEYVSNSNVLVVMSIPLLILWLSLLWFFGQHSKNSCEF